MMDQATLSRLVHGRQPNPTVDTLWRYARAVGRRLVLTHAGGEATQQRNGSSFAFAGPSTASRRRTRSFPCGVPLGTLPSSTVFTFSFCDIRGAAHARLRQGKVGPGDPGPWHRGKRLRWPA